MPQRLRIFILKILIGITIIFLLFFYFTKNVGKYDVHIRYDRIYDEINSPNKEQPVQQKKKETKEEKEEKDDIEKSEKIKQTLKKIFNNAVSQQHEASPNLKMNKELYEKLCSNYQKICSFCYFDKNYRIKEKIKYTAIIIYTIDQIDSILTTEKKLKDAIENISLDTQGKERRGYAGHHTLTFKTKKISNYTEFYEVLTHELGHIVDLGVIEGNQSPKDKEFTEFGKPRFFKDDESLEYYRISWKDENTRKKNEGFENFVSGYSLSDPFEDFAETFNFYLNHYLVFQKMSKNNYSIGKKFEFMKNIFGGEYLQGDKKNLEKIEKNSERRPWDTTKTY